MTESGIIKSAENVSKKTKHVSSQINHKMWRDYRNALRRQSTLPGACRLNTRTVFFICTTDVTDTKYKLIIS